MNPASKKAAATLPLVRCAIYTRKSTEEGLEQEFNSLDAQRDGRAGGQAAWLLVWSHRPAGVRGAYGLKQGNSSRRGGGRPPPSSCAWLLVWSHRKGEGSKVRLSPACR